MLIERFATVHDPDITEMPAEFRRVLTGRDVAAIHVGPDYFPTLTTDQSPDWLRELLRRLAKSRYTLQFHSTDGKPYRPYFRFHAPGGPTITLPRPIPLRPDLPPFLREIYCSIGGFGEGRADGSGGLLPSDTLKPLSDGPSKAHRGEGADPASAIVFLKTPSGGRLCYLADGTGAWIEAGRFRRVPNPESELASYFAKILEGTRV